MGIPADRFSPLQYSALSGHCLDELVKGEEILPCSIIPSSPKMLWRPHLNFNVYLTRFTCIWHMLSGAP